MSEEQGDVTPASPDIHFEPIIKLPLVEIKTLEENEDVLLQMRAKLYRYDSEDDPPQWKERGTGDVKILKHKSEEYVRLLMRRDKTLKICANHYIQPYMELKPNNTSDKAWVWSTLADFADEEPKPELLAIRFGSVENAQKFKEAFEEAKDISSKSVSKQNTSTDKEDSASDESSEEDEEKEKNGKEEDEPKTNSTPDKSTEEVVDKISNLAVKDDQSGDKKEESST